MSMAVDAIHDPVAGPSVSTSHRTYEIDRSAMKSKLGRDLRVAKRYATYSGDAKRVETSTALTSATASSLVASGAVVLSDDQKKVLKLVQQGIYKSSFL
jgi:hypothetical protein